MQTQAMLQVMLNIFQHGMEVQDAMRRLVASCSFRPRSRRSVLPGRLAARRADRCVGAAGPGGAWARGEGVAGWTRLTGSVEAVLSDRGPE